MLIGWVTHERGEALKISILTAQIVSIKIRIVIEQCNGAVWFSVYSSQWDRTDACPVHYLQ